MVSFSAGLIRVFPARERDCVIPIELPAARVLVPAGGRRPCACVHPSMSVFTIGETMTPWIARGIPCCVTSTTFEFPSPTDIDHIVAAGDAHEFRRSA